MVPVEEKRPVELDPAYDGPVIANYRPFSRAAMIAVPLTLLSALAMISPLLWIVPIAAVFISALAVRVTCFGEQPLVGRKVAIVCLLVSWFLLGYAPAQYLVSRSIICAQAESYANTWLELIRSGRLAEAYELHLMYYNRVAPDTDLKKYYEKRFPDSDSQLRKQMDVHDPYGEMNDFFKTTPLNDIVEASKNGQYHLESVSVLADESEFQVTLVELRYRYTIRKGAKGTSVPLHIRMRRILLADKGTKQWNVESATSGGSAPPVSLKR